MMNGVGNSQVIHIYCEKCALIITMSMDIQRGGFTYTEKLQKVEDNKRLFAYSTNRKFLFGVTQ